MAFCNSIMTAKYCERFYTPFNDIYIYIFIYLFIYFKTGVQETARKPLRPLQTATIL